MKEKIKPVINDEFISKLPDTDEIKKVVYLINRMVEDGGKVMPNKMDVVNKILSALRVLHHNISAKGITNVVDAFTQYSFEIGSNKNYLDRVYSFNPHLLKELGLIKSYDKNNDGFIESTKSNRIKHNYIIGNFEKPTKELAILILRYINAKKNSSEKLDKYNKEYELKISEENTTSSENNQSNNENNQSKSDFQKEEITVNENNLTNSQMEMLLNEIREIPNKVMYKIIETNTIEDVLKLSEALKNRIEKNVE